MAIMSGIEDRFRIALNCERFSPLFRLERTHLYQLRADRIIFEPNHTVRENIPGRQGEDMVKRRIEIVDPAEGQKQYQAIVADGHDISRTGDTK